MPYLSRSPANRRNRRLRRLRRRRLMIIAVVAAAAVIALAVILIAVRAPSTDERAEKAAAADTAPPESAAPSATPSPAPTPSPSPAPTPAPTPADMPSVLSFYRPESKSYSPRIRMGDTFTAPWKKGRDIGSFEVIASDADRLPGSFFGDIFGKAWTSFADSGACKIGYTLRYTLDDGREIRYTMLSPSHIEHTEYIECWLYDDYHREPHKSYSHIRKMGSDTLMTSIKLTCGSQIAHVRDIWLTAFVCSSLNDFDEDRNYLGDVSCTLHILKK